MKGTFKFAENLLWVILVLVVFLFATEAWFQVPAWLQPAGRLHPLLVHFPIVIVLAASAFYFVELKSGEFRITRPLALGGSLSAAMAALAGLLLSKEGGYDGDLLFWHRWTGLSVALLSTAFYFLLSRQLTSNILLNTLAGLCIAMLVIAGHLGGSITHGEDFLRGPGSETVARQYDSSLYQSAIVPVLENKCYGCHNQRKSKGRLILTSYDRMLKGGKDGPLWTTGSLKKSLLVERIALPRSDRKHMPPTDKAQLEPEEVELIRRWVESGADPAKRLHDFDAMINGLAAAVAARYTHHDNLARYHFAFAPAEKVKELNSPFRTVAQLASNEPALSADFFVRKEFHNNSLDELIELKEQIISINLSKMPVGDESLETLARFDNLETLNLNNTDVAGETLRALLRLQKLRSVSLSGTKVIRQRVGVLGASTSLQKVFLWNTPTDTTDLSELKREYPGIDWIGGYLPEKSEMQRLSPPLLVNEDQTLVAGEKVMLKSALPGATIRFTTDGTQPDSIRSPAFEDSIALGAYGIIKAKAVKDGWVSSQTVEFVFFRKGILPSSAKLKYPGDPKYPGIGAETVIDGVKGIPEFVQGIQWIAFREKPFDAVFYFDHAVSVHSITLSYSKNVGAMTMPPVEVEVWGGKDADHLRFLNKITPPQPTDYGTSRLEGALVNLPGDAYACYKVVAKPVGKLPAFRKAKKTDKGWLMMDEVIFN